MIDPKGGESSTAVDTGIFGAIWIIVCGCVGFCVGGSVCACLWRINGSSKLQP